MTDKSNVIIHIGRHKCASTSLQHFFFPQLTSQFYREKKILKFLKNKNINGDDIIQIISQNLKKFKQPHCINPQQDQLLIISREGLSKDNLHTYASKLKQAYPDAKILCIIREQFDLLLTLYVWLASKGDYISGLHKAVQKIMSTKDKEFLYHNKAIKIYMDYFGKDNVMVLPLELLKSEPEIFYKKIVEFIDPDLNYKIPSRKKNISYKKKAVDKGIMIIYIFELLFFEVPYKVLNKCGFDARGKGYRFFKNKIRLFSRHYLSVKLDNAFPKSSKLKLSINHYKMYIDEFAEMNDEIQELTGLDLESYGYVTTNNKTQFFQKHISR